ncbi:MAG: tetratricopeptide repeat protein [Gemmataceae bacterium]
METTNKAAAEAYEKGLEAIKNEDFKSAIIDLTIALQLDHEYASAYNNRGNGYSSINKHPEAIADFKKVIELDP